MVYPIIDQIQGKWISWNGSFMLVDDPACRPLFEPGDSAMVYEVLRVLQGLPLFWEDHIHRFERSLKGVKKLPENLYRDSISLIRKNQISEANLRIVLTDDSCVIHLIPSYYPDLARQRSGVSTGLLNWEREEPNIKSIRPDYKAAVARKFAEAGPYGSYFELLLADRQGYLTEGSRSNLFFIKDNTVYTAPDDRILLGITRKYVQRAIARAGGKLEVRMLKMDELHQCQADAAFITGSPIDILAISAIEDYKINSGANPLLQKIDAAYQAIVQQYLDDHRAAL